MSLLLIFNKMSGRYRFRRRSGWRSSYGRARSRYNRGRTSIIRRAKGNARAANNQADSTDVIINLMHKDMCMVQNFYNNVCTAETTANDILLNTIQCGTCAINIFDLLSKSSFFNCYAPMYDQFRITSIKVKITPISWSTYDQHYALNNLVSNVNNIPKDNNHPNPTDLIEDKDRFYTNLSIAKLSDSFDYPQALTVVTAWDRTGLSPEQFNLLRAFLEPELTEEEKIQAATQIRQTLYIDGYKNNNQGMEWIPVEDLLDTSITNIGDRITTYSSAQTKQLIAGQQFNCTRYLYPQTQQEKSLFYSTNDLRPQFRKDNNSILYKEVEDGYDGTFALCHPSENVSTPFKPTLLIGVLANSDMTISKERTPDLDHIAEEVFIDNTPIYHHKIRPVKFNCEFDIGVTFRGLRKTQVV